MINRSHEEGEEFDFIHMEDLPDFWKHKIMGTVHWSVKEGKCPQCGSLITIRVNPRRHYHCTGCGVNYVE